VVSTEPGVYNFTDDSALQATGENDYIQTQLSGSPTVANTPIKSGFLEGSNVNLTQQMSGLLVSQRSFEMNSQIVQTADQIAEMANGLK